MTKTIVMLYILLAGRFIITTRMTTSISNKVAFSNYKKIIEQRKLNTYERNVHIKIRTLSQLGVEKIVFPPKSDGRT